MNKTITGYVGNKKIVETIEQYQENIAEQVCTARRNIIKKFESQGFSEKDVRFDDKSLSQ